MKKTNNGEGVPIEVTLKELKYLDKRKAFSITPQLKSELKKVATYYHDLKTTSDEIAKALENTRLSPSAGEQYGKFNAKIWKMNDVFFKTIDNLDLNEKDGAKVSQLSEAIKAYGTNPLAGQYMRKFRQLLRRYPLVRNTKCYYMAIFYYMASITSGEMVDCDWLRSTFSIHYFPVIDRRSIT